MDTESTMDLLALVDPSYVTGLTPTEREVIREQQWAQDMADAHQQATQPRALISERHLPLMEDTPLPPPPSEWRVMLEGWSP